MLSDCLGICFYLGATLVPHGRLLPDDLAEAYNAVTGMNLKGKDLLLAAERCNQIQRGINRRSFIGNCFQYVRKGIG